jgi:hypothetical protein
MTQKTVAPDYYVSHFYYRPEPTIDPPLTTPW